MEKQKPFFYEDYYVGQKFKFKAAEFTKENIMEFAHKHDPLPIHIDENYATNHTIFKGLIASGFQTIVNCWGEFVKLGYGDKNVVAGMGMDGIKWFKPVYAGDELGCTLTIVEKMEMPKKQSGIVKTHLEAINQKGELTMEMYATQMVKKKE